MSQVLRLFDRRSPAADVLGAVQAPPGPATVRPEPSRGVGRTVEGPGDPRPAASVPRVVRLRPRLALFAILLVSAALNLAYLDRQGYGNTYYAAAVKSMLTGWRAFFLASFDAGGFVSVDKPPVGLWVQAASAALLGFSGPSLFLPQAVASVLSVAVLYHLVGRAFGTAAGLLAALALAVMPINVVTARNNTMDSQLVLILLLAAWAASIAAETGRVRPLLACAALVGLGYNVKMLQAYPVLPAFGLAYVLWAPIRRRARLARLGLATIVLLAVSLSWSAVVDLTPPDRRPFVGSSGTDSALSLALGYNGLGRLTEALATRIPVPQLVGVTVDLTVAPGFAPGIGMPGPARLFSQALAAQVSWLLPLAVLGLVVAGHQAVGRGQAIGAAASEELRRRVALVIWGGWLLVWGAYFSVARFYHIYYLVMLGPGVAALAGIGTAALWRAYRRGGPQAWGLPVGLLGTATVQATILAAYPEWASWLAPLVLIPCLVAAVALVGRRRSTDLRWAAGATALGVLALLVAPTVWAGTRCGPVRRSRTATAAPAAPGGAIAAVRPTGRSRGRAERRRTVPYW